MSIYSLDRAHIMRIGIIGLGLMGSAFANNLLAAGHQVIGWNREQNAVDDLVQAGGIAAEKPLDVFQQSEAVISMLANDQAVANIFLESGLIEAIPKGSIHINMATISVTSTQALEAAHKASEQHYVAATVLGNASLAQAAKIHVLAAGDPQVIESLRVVFNALSQSLRIVGTEAQTAVITKIAMNFLLGTAVEALAESHSLIRAYGLDPLIYQEIIDNTLLGSPAYQLYGGKIANATFEPAAFRLSLAGKDLHLVQQTANHAGLTLPLADTVVDRLDKAMNAGHADKDLAALALL